MSGPAAAQPDPSVPPVVDPWEEPPPPEPPAPVEPPAPIEPPEPKREDPKPARATDPTLVRPSLHMRQLPYVIKRPVQPDYGTEPFVGDPEPARSNDSKPETRSAALEPDVRADADEAPARPAYPRSFVDRPMILPSGLQQFQFSGHIGRESVDEYKLDYAGGTVGIVRGARTFEAAIGMDLTLLHNDNFPDRVKQTVPLFRRVSLAFNFRLPYETLIGVQGVVGNLGTSRQRYSPSVYVEHKIRPSEKGAIFVGGGVSYSHDNQEVDDYDFTTKEAGGWAMLAGRVQVTPEFAAQVSGTAAAYKFVDDRRRNQDSYTSVGGEASLWISVTENADLIPFFGMSSVEDLEVMSGGLSMRMR
jgi:hypothetical protein